MSIKIIGLGGSLKSGSTSRAALNIALDSAKNAGAVATLYDLQEMNLPMYDPLEKNIPDKVQALADDICEAQGMIWSSPLYHGTISGAFKNALDWMNILADRKPPYLTDKIIGLISTAGGVQGLQAINTMEFIVRALRGWAVPLVMPVPKSWQVFDKDGNISDKQIEQQLQLLGKEVVRASEQMGREGKCDYSE